MFGGSVFSDFCQTEFALYSKYFTITADFIFSFFFFFSDTTNNMKKKNVLFGFVN